MTIASVWLVEDNGIKKTKRVKVVGHSNYAEAGYDIVCSSISTAMIMTGNLVEKLCPKCQIIYDEKEINIDIKLIEFNDTAYIVMDNLYEMLKDLSDQYPKYFKIEIIG